MLGIVVLRSPSLRSTPTRLAAFWKWSGKDSHTALLRPALPGISDDYIDAEEKAKVRILMCLPGWGEKRARSAVKHFGNPGVVLDLIRQGDWRGFSEVEGVGKGLVMAGQKFLG
jgi:hypothetical protein